jgi:hypothetical protein
MSPFGPRRRDTIYELRATLTAIEKLAARAERRRILRS